MSATYKVGEHQGIFIIGNEYNFDDRFRASMSKVQWTKGSFKEIVEAPYSSDDSKKQSLPFGDRALCKHKRIEDYSLDIYNHGRTVAKKPIKGKGIPIKQMAEFSIGPQEYWEWSKVGPILNQEGIATQSCIEKITDGFCDSVCGNCSYVLLCLTDFWCEQSHGANKCAVSRVL